MELDEDLFDGVQIGAVGRQEEGLCPGSADGCTNIGGLVAAEVIHDDHVARMKRGGQHLLDIGLEGFAIDRAVEHPGRIDPVASQGGEKRHRVPMAERRFRLQPLAARCPAAQGRHVGLGPGFIDEDQPGGINTALISLPLRPVPGDIRSVLLAGQHAFF